MSSNLLPYLRRI